VLTVLNDIRKDVQGTKFGGLQCDELERQIRALASSTAPAPAVPEGCKNNTENFPCRSWCGKAECRSSPAVALEPTIEEPKGLPYGIIDPDYARVYTQARIVAWQYGYACVMHGSFTRDLDLLLVPWTKEARGNNDQLLKLIADSCSLRFRDGVEPVYKAVPDYTEKPHGRKSCSLFFPGANDRRWIDISVLPATQPSPEATRGTLGSLV
jgi:hypothetical protein